MEGCTHAVLGTWPGAVCGRKGGVMVWAKAIGEMLESEEWPNLDTILWICSNFLNSWKGIKYSFCSSNGPKISIHFHIQEIAKKLAKAPLGPEPASMVLCMGYCPNSTKPP